MNRNLLLLALLFFVMKGKGADVVVPKVPGPPKPKPAAGEKPSWWPDSLSWPPAIKPPPLWPAGTPWPPTSPGDLGF